MGGAEAIKNLKSWAMERGIEMVDQDVIVEEATDAVRKQHNIRTSEEVKANFDRLVIETEEVGHKIYLDYEAHYGTLVLKEFLKELKKQGKIEDLESVGDAFGANFRLLDRFFLSLAQSRKSRAGRSFEKFHNTLFKELNYPFEEQVVINGKPDFLMPSAKHYRENAMDCIIFTAKRTLRERWRQIVTEGTRGLGFFLATIDKGVSANQIDEMRNHRIYLVVPEKIKQEFYPDKVNVISFNQFFKDHLDPVYRRWQRNGVVA